MKEGRVTAADVRDQFDYDAETGEFLRKRLRANNQRPDAGTANGAGNLVVGINGGHELLHRLVWLWVHGAWPPKQIEHINGDKTDNRLANLRLRNRSAKQELTLDRLKGLLRYDQPTGKFYWRETTRGTIADEEAGSVRQNGYRAITIDWKSYYAHRLVWLWETGNWPKYNVDHKNGNRDDNRVENLRDRTTSQNTHNTNKLGPRNTTGFRGVARYMDKFIAQIMVDGERMAIGMFDTAEEAHEAYKKKHIELFGELPANESTVIYPKWRKAKA